MGLFDLVFDVEACEPSHQVSRRVECRQIQERRMGVATPVHGVEYEGEGSLVFWLALHPGAVRIETPCYASQLAPADAECFAAPTQEPTQNCFTPAQQVSDANRAADVGATCTG